MLALEPAAELEAASELEPAAELPGSAVNTLICDMVACP